MPTPVTGASSNHFREHLTHLERFREHFPGKKIVFYDLGLTHGEKTYLQRNKDVYEYRFFNYTEYPSHFLNLKNYAWKVAIWADVLPKYGAIAWFDSSIWFWKSPDEAIEEKIRTFNSSWIYYIKAAGHDILSHTHPKMYGYFPSNWTQHSLTTTVLVLKIELQIF